MHDPRLKTIYVVSDEMSKLLAASVRQQQYGAVQAEAYTSVDKAVQHARRQLAAS